MSEPAEKMAPPSEEILEEAVGDARPIAPFWASLAEREWLSNALLYAGLAVVCLLLVAWIMHLTPSALTVPLGYQADAVWVQTSVKGMIDHGWTYANPSVGVPGGQSLLDYPTADTAHLLVLKALSSLVREPILATNLYFVLGFVAIALATMYVLRHFRVSPPAAFVASIAFTFLPYHLMRGVGHLFLGAYWSIPLTTLIALWVASDQPPFFSGGRFWFRDRRTMVAMGIAVVIGCSGIYYAVFSCLLLVVSAIFAWGWRRGLVSVLPGLLLAGIVAAAALFNLAPSIVYRRVVGPNPEAVIRQTYEAELYSLKITQLVLPVDGHTYPPASTLKNRYNAGVEALNPAFLNENEMASLGLLGTIGFFALLLSAAAPLHRFSKGSPLASLTQLSVMNVAALLVGTFGGLGSLFTLLSPVPLRAFNRISVYIAFLSLFGLALLLDRFVFSRAWAQRVLVAPLIVTALIVFALWDQTYAGVAPDVASLRAQSANDRTFVQQVEQTMPPGSMVFQLPYVPFPESPPVGGMTDYEHFKAYLYSKTLRWSYGAMRGRESDLWQRQVSALPPPDFVAAIKAKGFRGVWVDLRGAPEKEQQLREALGTEPLKSADGHLVFFALK